MQAKKLLGCFERTIRLWNASSGMQTAMVETDSQAVERCRQHESHELD